MKFSGAIPIIRIFDEAKARGFYVDFLGFNVDFEHRFEDGFPLYAQISMDDCILHLSEHYGDGAPGANVRVETQDVEEYNRQLLAKQYKYARPGIQITPWNTREMTISDPFGNRITFYDRHV